MLEKNIRKTYYEYFKSFEKIKKNIIKYLYSKEIFLYKKDKEIIEISFKIYLESINKLTKQLDEENVKDKEYQKMLNQTLYEINKKQQIISKSFENLLEDELEKTYYCKSNMTKILEIHKQIVISINMYSSFTTFIYEYPIKNIQSVNYSKLEKGDIILSMKSESIINKNIFYKLISKITKSNIGHSTIFLGLNDNKPEYMDIKDGDLTIKNLVIRPDSIKFIRTSNNYSKEIIGLVLRIRGGLSKTEEKLIFEYIDSKINIKYGFFKVLIGLLFGKIYENLSIKKLSFINPIRSVKTMFCSELIIRTYENAHIYLRNKSDPATTTPVDLLNSPQLEVIGYVDK
jgi:hypothetical protein